MDNFIRFTALNDLANGRYAGAFEKTAATEQEARNVPFWARWVAGLGTGLGNVFYSNPEVSKPNASAWQRFKDGFNATEHQTYGPLTELSNNKTLAGTAAKSFIPLLWGTQDLENLGVGAGNVASSAVEGVLELPGAMVSLAPTAVGAIGGLANGTWNAITAEEGEGWDGFKKGFGDTFSDYAATGQEWSRNVNSALGTQWAVDELSGWRKKMQDNYLVENGIDPNKDPYAKWAFGAGEVAGKMLGFAGATYAGAKLAKGTADMAQAANTAASTASTANTAATAANTAATAARTANTAATTARAANTAAQTANTAATASTAANTAATASTAANTAATAGKASTTLGKVVETGRKAVSQVNKAKKSVVDKARKAKDWTMDHGGRTVATRAGQAGKWTVGKYKQLPPWMRPKDWATAGYTAFAFNDARMTQNRIREDWNYQTDGGLSEPERLASIAERHGFGGGGEGSTYAELAESNGRPGPWSGHAVATPTLRAQDYTNGAGSQTVRPTTMYDDVDYDTDTDY